MNKIEKIEKFVQDMRCDVAELQVKSNDKGDLRSLQKYIYGEIIISTIQGYIQDVKAEE